MNYFYILWWSIFYILSVAVYMNACSQHEIRFVKAPHFVIIEPNTQLCGIVRVRTSLYRGLLFTLLILMDSYLTKP